MELTTIANIKNQVITEKEITQVSTGNFIEANTQQVSLEHLKKDCIIPVYSDNETTIAHSEFIEATKEVVSDLFNNEVILKPNIRISHIIKGRVPSALGKPTKELTDDEKTIYYQRCAFMIELPHIKEQINNCSLSLVIGGVRALNQENLYSKRSIEKFKVFIGFKNSVCTNLCITTDGLQSEIRVTSIQELKERIRDLISSFDSSLFINKIKTFNEFSLNETQFAHTIGKMRMYQHLSKSERTQIPLLSLSDNQIGTVVKEYYLDPHFSKDSNGTISLWKFYNLLTSANKSSYIDSNLERNVNAYEFVNNLTNSMKNQSKNWFLN